MKKLYYEYLTICYLFLMLLGSAFEGNAQVIVPFKERTSSFTPTTKTYHVKGNFTMMGNTNLTLQNYGVNTTNGTNAMKYVDIDGDNSTLNSSSSTLVLPTDSGSNLDCSKIVYAGLYWTGRVSNSATSPDSFSATNGTLTKTLNKRKISFKGPSASGYDTFTATDIYFPTNTNGNMFTAYAEVTTYVKDHGVGEYFAADIAATQGSDGGNIGKYAGWALIVVYENSSMKNRDITIFDGHAYVRESETLSYNIPVSGFNSVASGPVGIKLGIMAGEGDVNYTGDYFKIKRRTAITDLDTDYISLSRTGNSTTNFFNSSIYTGGNTRNPNLVNNSGIDISMFDLPNTTKDIIGNNQSSTTFRYGSTVDTYTIFAIAMAVDAYVPEIEGTLTATTINGSPAGAGPYSVLPGQEMGYKLQIKNKGSEPILNSKIVIPIPYNATFVSGSLGKTINFSPAPTPNNLTYEPTIGASGSIVWDLGTLPLPTNSDTVLAELTFKLKSTENCALLKNSNCSNVIAVNGTLNGTGINSGVAVNNKPFILGYTAGGNCSGVAISAPLQTTINTTNFVDANCQSTPPIIAFTFCNTASTIPITDVTGSFPTGSTFYNNYPIVAGTTTQYTINNPFPATVGTNTYYAIPPGGNGSCFFQFTIKVQSITSNPTVNGAVNYCVGDVTVPLTATATNPGYTLYYYLTNTSTAQQSITPSSTTAGQFTYYVAEGISNACIGPKTPITVNIYAKPTLVITNPAPICPSATTTNLSAPEIVAGSTAGLVYTYWTDTAASISYPGYATATPGTYYIKGANSTTNCYDIKPVIITKSNLAVTEVVASHINVNCKDASTGSATATATGGTGTYTYSWNTNPIQNSATANNLKAGTYIVTVTDQKGCTDTEEVIITEPQLSLTANISAKTDVNCKGASTGSATATATGGTGTYTYSWNTNPIQNSATANNLKAGTYIVTVTDQKGCTDTEEVIITEPQLSLTASISTKTDVNCKGATTGSATATATGGTGTYSYSWNTNPIQNSATANNLKAGTYIVTVTDQKGCTDTEEVIISEPQLSLTASISAKTDVNCKGGTTGSATATATGGTGTYTYSWNTNPVQNSATANNLKAGTYIVTVTDQKGCTDTEEVIITEPQLALTASISAKTDVNCKGATTGSATATATGGTGTYSYSWNTNPIQNSATANNLKAGTYVVTVTDQKGCTDTEEVIITEPQLSLTASISAKTDVNCKGGTTGSATATATGGTGTYTYSWNTNPIQNSATANNLKAGTYIVTVTDQKGCTDTEEVIITEPQLSLTASISTKTDVNCKGASTGSATATATGGTGTYTYSWNTNPVQNSATANNLKAGTYIVTVTDQKGCTDTEEVIITEPQLSLTATKSKIDATCGGASTGSATVVVSGGTGNYTYSWNTVPIQTSATANNLIAGNYSVTITDAKGCTLTETFEILDGDSVKPVIAPLPETSTINCPAEPVFAQATATDNNVTIASLTFTDSISQGNCDGSYIKTRTWTATDACGNISLPVSQVIIVQDISKPTWTTPIASLNKTLECSDSAALTSVQALFPTASDSCDSDVSDIVKISGAFVASANCSNAGTYTNTWTVKDDCGNISDTFTQVITIQDTTKPIFIGNLPTDITVSCDAVPEPATVETSDNCSTDLPNVFSETKSNIQNGCANNYTLTRTWTTSDCAGNVASISQIITVRDTTPPTGTAPIDVANLQNIADIPVGNPGDIKDAADNCSGTVNITVSDSNNQGSGCEGNAYILTRTYTLTDCSGNKTELKQTFTVENKVSVSGIATNVTCSGGKDGSILVTNSAGSTVIIRNENNQIVGNTNLPAGTYTLTATSPVNTGNQTCSATATVVITQPAYTVKISGQIINKDTNTPIANVPVTLVPQGNTSGPILLRITGSDGLYNFSGVVAGSYLVQVQDANLNSAYQLYPVDSSLFFTTLEDCKIQQHNFEYGASTLPVLGDYVWYDTNSDGIQNEWYDANNDGVVTKNIPDVNGSIDYSKWEWIDLNGDGSYAGPSNVGELNAGGFGNALSANVIIDGPNGYHDEVIVGIEGFWRNRPQTANPFGDYTIKLVKDANFNTVAASLGATGLVKVLPSVNADKKVTAKTAKSQLHTVCVTTGGASGYIVTVTPQDLVHLDSDFGVNCKVYQDIIANDDSAGPIAGINTTTPNVLNVLHNDTLEGIVVTPTDVILTTVTPNPFLHLNTDGSVDILPNAPVGTLTLVYQICEADQTDNCDTATVTITIEAPVMTVTATAVCVNDVPYIDYVVTPVNFTPVNGVTIAWANTSDTVITTMNNLPLTGRALWPGAVVDGSGKGIDWPGWVFENNKWIQAADGFETLRPTVKLIISVNPTQTITVNYPPSDPYCTSRPTFAIVANDDNAGPITANVAQTNVINVLTNDSLNGSPINLADVTLTVVTPDPKGALTLNPDGSIDIKANTPAGTYTLTYQICEKADFGNCDTAIVTIIVADAPAPPTPVIANDDTYANIGCNTFGLVGNVLSNDLKGIVPATLTLVNFTLLSQNVATKTDPNITIDASGNVTVSSLTPAGTYTYTYQICDKLSADNCDTAIVTITVIPNGVTTVASEACNDDSSIINLLSLLPANTPTTGTWIDAQNTNTITGNNFNPLGLALGNYTFEYKITDQNCPRSILLNMEINDDCKVLACGNVVVHNAMSPNGDGINDIFQIDSIDDLTCYPENNVEIYNRWGILVFETENYNNSTNAFDGISRGRTTVKKSDGLPSGTYFYIINYKSLDGNNVIQNNKKDGYLYLSK
jgi:gliding motility-associated-like protein